MIVEIYEPTGTKWLHDTESHVNLLHVFVKLIDNLTRIPVLEFFPKKLLSWFVHTHIEWLKPISAVCWDTDTFNIVVL